MTFAEVQKAERIAKEAGLSLRRRRRQDGPIVIGWGLGGLFAGERVELDSLAELSDLIGRLMAGEVQYPSPEPEPTARA